ncbi:aspartate/glutamate racemase family protein [Agrobacterium sp. SHOUNA12C]|uniref:Aspartate racemase protein n=2 Tax=Rhizobium rhizogenes TaxID=359 RepID=B9JGI2_RHIR8|nr:aspartate/glutamate racemase family protein [Rhizobium rhizogenes]ACM26956.1 aspartate racemase protein [Rhizobium rhizogenes K84]KAA6489980.1 aspartate/glutamate racemase family protein [Agrobacterium sp. ICMP 7243]MCJ9720183.1 aspartate/glutamate racemase family protein [Agrobacterium sp. BETTINA12B]MCJ9755572.1 aspartate/glutamate racemase family protein [Agrobacterium sp. SHOUNA12C]OCJ05773.1 aspartate racemase [Agrobacterium sp. 13-626]OCJ30882.1 aspartate racemase [Agrobacterium sp. 
MRIIGLIGGMSFESSAVYYRLINEMVRDRLGGLASAEVLMYSVNFEEIVSLQKAGRWDAAAARLGDVAHRLQAAGAECVLICTNTMHLIAPEVAARISVPLINIIDETAAALKAAGRVKPLLLATRYTMEHGFYADRMARNGVSIMVPGADDRTLVHDIIFNELCAGIVKDESRNTLVEIIDRAKAAGADSVILGCTEICLILDPNGLALPGFDSTTIHAQAAIDFALGAEKTRASQAA